HHAKVLREAGRYQIMDLGSANGVRVNGEEYGKVELRKGDHIDLGHVRLRFVAPNEDFVFARDAQIVDVDTSKDTGKKGNKTLVIAIGAALVVLIGVVAVVALRNKGETGPDSGGGSKKGKVAEYIVDAQKALKAMDWDTAIAKAEE